MDDLSVTYLIKNTVFGPFYLLHTAQNVNKIFPGCHDKVKAIKSRGKSWVYATFLKYRSTVTNNVSMKRHLQKANNAILLKKGTKIQ